MSSPKRINERIASLRGLMKREKLAAFIIPSSDPHQSEYVCDHWKIRAWMSGFDGSAGTLVVTQNEALLWTDSRYFLQAKMDLKNTDIQLYKEVMADNTNIFDWLVSTLEKGDTIGCNCLQFSINQMERMKKKVLSAGLQIDDKQNLISEVWKKRPPLPDALIFEHNENYSGESRKHKIGKIRHSMLAKGVDVHLISALDDIAWTLNLRGEDVACNPVFISYLWIEPEQVILFINKSKVPEQIALNLKSDDIQIIPYKGISGFMEQMEADKKVWIDPANTNKQIYEWLVEQQAEIIKGRSPATTLKARKNKTELGYIRQAMIKDGIALTKMSRWLEMMLDKVMVTEYEVSKQLNRYRQAQGNFKGDSFDAIVGYNANGAIVHYRPKPAESLPIKPDGLLLVDSGGQYLEGTTDITRTYSLGPVSEQQKKHYTLVLKGHIALSKAVFPKGTTGVQLDILARQYLWQRGLNYGHGTGHGVGFFLNVHEGPQSIGADSKGVRTTVAIEPGMIVSNEPGYYLEGQYGIRIENLIVCVESDIKGADGQPFLGFETLSLFPYELDLIDGSLLSVTEKQWVKDYHQRVFELLKPGLSPEEVKWLEKKCQPVR